MFKDENKDTDYITDYEGKMILDSLSVIKKGGQCYIYNEKLAEKLKKLIEKHKLQYSLVFQDGYWTFISHEIPSINKYRKKRLS